MRRNDAIRFIALRTLGNFLVLFSLYGVVATFGPALSYELQYRIIDLRGVKFQVAADSERHCEGLKGPRQSPEGDCFVAPTSGAPRNDEKQGPGFAEILAGDKKQILIPKDPLFSILIPKIGASAQVFPNVDPTNPQDFLPVLQHGVAHAKGSVFPGHPGTTYLFAHSADNWWDVGRYNAIFYTLNNLTEKDEIVVFFENRRYNYVVKQKLISDPEDITLITSKQEGDQQLVLQTCWPPGTTWKRLYIIAVPKKA